MTFHIDPGTQQDGDRDDPQGQRRPACDWDTWILSSSPLPASHLTKIKDLHGRIDTQVSRDAMIQEPESDGKNRSHYKQRSFHLNLDLLTVTSWVQDTGTAQEA